MKEFTTGAHVKIVNPISRFYEKTGVVEQIVYKIRLDETRGHLEDNSIVLHGNSLETVGLDEEDKG